MLAPAAQPAHGPAKAKGALMLLNARVSSLTRRVAGLPAEIQRWLLYAGRGEQFEKNSSQLEALDIFMSEVTAGLERASAGLSLSANSDHSDAARLLPEAEQLERELFKSYFIWAYFRGKLEQRFVPQFADALTSTDLVSHDCYRAALGRANSLGVEHKLGLRDYPLTFFLENYPSPVTWPRDVALRGLAGRSLPVPVIGIPWDYIATPWEWLSLHHEVAHAIDADLGMPSKEMEELLVRSSHPRASVWQLWMGEVFADAAAILLAGPAFVSYLATSLLLPAKAAPLLSEVGKHPPAYLRVVLNARIVREFIPSPAAHEYLSDLLKQWEFVYGQPPPDAADYFGDIDAVMAILGARLDTLKGKQGVAHGLRELVTFGADDFEKQLAAREQILAGRWDAVRLPLRHIPAAAYMAVEQEINSRGALESGVAESITTQLNAAVKAKAPAGQLPIRPEASRRYLQDLAKAFLADEPAGGADGQKLP